MKPFRLVAAALALALAFTGVSAFETAQPAAQAADGRQFDPGDIISDALFFDGGVMSASDVQTFLNSQVSACRSGYTCLKDYRQTTTSRAAVDGLRRVCGRGERTRLCDHREGGRGLWNQPEGADRAAREGAGPRHR